MKINTCMCLYVCDYSFVLQHVSFRVFRSAFTRSYDVQLHMASLHGFGEKKVWRVASGDPKKWLKVIMNSLHIIFCVMLGTKWV